MSALSQIAARHWLLGGIAVSLLWFIAGRQSLSNRRADAALYWQSVAVIIGMIVCGWAIAEKEWLGVGAASAVIYFEVRSIRRWALKAKVSE